LKLFTFAELTRTQSSSQNLGLTQLISLIFTVFMLFFTPHWIATAQTVQIPDPNLRAALELALDKEAGADITQAEMASLESLQASKCRFLMLSEIGRWVAHRWECQSPKDGEDALREALMLSFESGIQNLTGLEFATNLTNLHLSLNRISDLHSKI
jgi:hypothetical protein